MKICRFQGEDLEVIRYRCLSVINTVPNAIAPATTNASKIFPCALTAPPVNVAGCGCDPFTASPPPAPDGLNAPVPAATPLGPTVAVANCVAVPPPTPTVTTAVAVAVPPPRVTVLEPPVGVLVFGAAAAGAVGTMALASGIWTAMPPLTCFAGVLTATEAAALA